MIEKERKKGRERDGSLLLYSARQKGEFQYARMVTRENTRVHDLNLDTFESL